jgi:hypothetical protein
VPCRRNVRACSRVRVWVQTGCSRGRSVPGRRQTAQPGRGALRFAFYGRVSTEDYQDPVTSRARQFGQAGALVAGRGQIVAHFFDIGQSRTLAWARRPQAAALADPDRGWDAIVIGEYEQAFYGSQYAAMAPLFEHHGVQLWMPEVGGRVDYASEHDERAMTVLGLSSKREITRTSIRVRTAMAAQARELGRYLGGRPPYGYRLADAGPHPNKAHAAWGRRAHRLEPDPETAHVVQWMFAQRLAGHSAARAAPARRGQWARRRRSWGTRGTRAVRCGTGSAPTGTWSTRPTPGSGTGRCSGGTAGWSRPGPTGRRPTGAATATPAPRNPIPADPRTPTSARTASCRTCPPCTCFGPGPSLTAGDEGACGAEPTSGARSAKRMRSGTCATAGSPSPTTRPRQPCRQAPCEAAKTVIRKAS